jgi:hypothetical protein
VRSTMPAHPRRASVGGPLQNSHEHAALVRDALDILSASPAIAAALGTPPFKEGRLQVLQVVRVCSRLVCVCMHACVHTYLRT